MIKNCTNLITLSQIFVITILVCALFVDTNDKFESTKPEIVTAKIGQDSNDSNNSPSSSGVSDDKKTLTLEKKIKQNTSTDNVKIAENQTKGESPNPLTAEKLKQLSLKPSKTVDDKLILPESVDNSINTQTHNDTLYNSDKNEKVQLIDMKSHLTDSTTAGASETAGIKSSSKASKISATKEEEKLPAPPLLNWDYTVNDAYDDDELYSKTFTELYDIGVEAYLENNWRDCITYLETALHEFRVYRHGLINCRIQCLFELERTSPFFDTNIEQMQFFDLTTRRALCLGKCHNKLLRKQYLPPFYLQRSYRERFVNRRPYEYLQLCYYKVMK